MGDWVLVGAKIQPALKGWLAEFALERRISVSEVLRRAIVEYLANHAESTEELEVAETIKRRRFEAMKLEIPKDEFDIFQFPSRVKKYVYEVRDSWERDGFLVPDLYDNLVSFVEKEKRVIEGNPQEDILMEMLDKIIAGLRDEQARMRKGKP